VPELFTSKTLTCNLYSLFTVVLIDWYAAELFKFNLPLPLEVCEGDPSPVVQLLILDANSPLVTNSLGAIVNESLSIFLKSAGKSYSLSPVVKFCVVLAYNKGISAASL